MSYLRKSLFNFLGIIIFMAIIVLPAEAQIFNNVKIQVKSGFDGVFKAGCYNNIYIDVTNSQGSNRFKGFAEIKIDASGTYRVNLDVPAPGHKQYVLPVLYPYDYQVGQSLLIKNSLGIPIDRIKITIKEVIKPKDKMIVVVNPNMVGLGTLNRADFTYPILSAITGYGVKLGPEPENSFDPHNYRIMQKKDDGIRKINTGYLKLEELPTSLVEYDSFDALIIQDGDFSQVSSESVNALEAWVRAGNIVVLVTGDKVGRIATSKLATLLPRTYTGTTAIKGIPAGLLSYTGVRISSGADLVVAQGKMLPGSQVVAGSQAMPLIVRKQLGFGEVVELAFDFLSPPVSNYSSSFDEALWSGILGSTLSRARPRDVAVAGSKIINQLSQTEQKSGGLILRVVGFFLLAYIIILGPMNFFTLAKLKLHTLLWITIPTTIVLFTVGGIVIGNIVQGGVNRLTTVDQLFITTNLHDGAQTSYIAGLRNFFSAGDQKVQLSTKDPLLYMSNRVNLVESNSMIGFGQDTVSFDDKFDDTISFNAGNFSINRQQPRWSFDFDTVYGLTDKKWSASLTNAILEPDNIKGTLTLNLPSTLYNAKLYAGSKEDSIGNLPAGKAIDLAKIYSKTNDFSDPDFTPWSNNVLSSLQTNLLQLSTDQIWLIGMVKDQPIELKFNARGKAEHFTLVAFNLGSTNRLRKDILPRIHSISIFRDNKSSINQPLQLGTMGYSYDTYNQLSSPEFSKDESAKFDIYFNSNKPGVLRIEGRLADAKDDQNNVQEISYPGIDLVQVLNRETNKYETASLPVNLSAKYFGPDNLVRLYVRFRSTAKINAIRMSNLR